MPCVVCLRGSIINIRTVSRVGNEKLSARLPQLNLFVNTSMLCTSVLSWEIRCERRVIARSAYWQGAALASV